MDGTEIVNFEKLGAIAAVCGLLVFVVKWLLGSFIERLKAIETAVNEVNDAVNHAHERGPDAMKLYDIVTDAHQRGQRVEDAVSKIAKWKLETTAHLKSIDQKIDECAVKINKYGCPALKGESSECLKESQPKDH